MRIMSTHVRRQIKAKKGLFLVCGRWAETLRNRFFGVIHRRRKFSLPHKLSCYFWWPQTMCDRNPWVSLSWTVKSKRIFFKLHVDRHKVSSQPCNCRFILDKSMPAVLQNLLLLLQYSQCRSVYKRQPDFLINQGRNMLSNILKKC